MRLLIVGETSTQLNAAIDIANQRQAKVALVQTWQQAIEFICQGKGTDLILMDAKFDIKSLINSMQNEKISTPVVAYGIDASPKEAVAAIKAGAKEFLPLPPDERLIAAIFAALADDNTEIIGNSALMHDAIKIADKIAVSDANILITGQSGTGKEVFANYIHHKSKRKSKPFVSVNCAAIPENLLESELFGHEKGAFTGALSRRIGKFEESSGGTLLLDEISEMDVRLQAKLLRAIQEKTIDRVGGTSPVRVDLRIIATSNRDLQEAIKRHEFREDLYFRLSVINVELPPLRDRGDDVRLLGEFFINKYTQSNNLGAKKLSKAALDKMLEYNWPGNVRELENMMHRAVLISNGEIIEPEDLNIILPKSDAALSENNQISSAEKQMMFNTIGYCLGDMNKAANILGVSIDILKEKLKNCANSST